jgi:aminoglycoside phosphotransferase (APT) family kinase protein
MAGRSLDALPAPALAGALRDAARWLAALHLSRLRLDRTLELTHEIAGAAEWAALVAREHPAAAASATRLAIALERSGKQLRVDRATPIHKDFHYQHVIVGERVGVVDLDEARMGDPSFDVGHFVANLQLLALRSGASAEDGARGQGSFLRAYAGVTGWSADARLGWFAAYTCVKIAKQLASGRGPLPRPERGARAAQIDLILREGLTWLES